MRRILVFCLVLIAAMSGRDSLAQMPGAVKTEVRRVDSSYRLYRAGRPYFVRGAGGTTYMDRLVQRGGNSIRTWSTANGSAVLDQAQELGLTVTMGLDVARERHGFDYNDTGAVRRQLERLQGEVRRYKNHPALLLWGIGNELNLNYKNPKVWDAVNAIAAMIHREDPNHPVTTMLAGVNQRDVDAIRARCPELDLLSVQVYGGLARVPQQLRAAGWEGAYLVTEWGPTGHWEGLQTAWGAPVEESSSEKAAVYKSRYEASIERDRQHCLGSYVFLWGQKQERTPTWYGLFTETGEASEVADVMQFLWTGRWPKNRAPHLYSFQLAGKKATEDVVLKPGSTCEAMAAVFDPDNDPLRYRWELLEEATKVGEGGDREERPKTIQGRIRAAAGNRASLVVPERKGAYRLFVYISDGQNHVATANLPFLVQD